jgi:hypothetical protein
MPSNYVLLEKVTLTASAASVVFDNIPQSGYTDLKVVISARTDRATGSVATVSLQLNSTTTSVYSSKELSGTGSASDYGQYSNVAPTSTNVGRISQSTDTANTFGSLEVYIPNYLGSTAKSASCESVQENNATAAFAQMTAWLCTDTSAINALTFTTNAGTNFIANSEFCLYGLAAVGTTPELSPFATGGDVVTNDGTYWYHAFLSSGLFTPKKSITADCLVIAGGGGTSANYGGGGAGAGGLVYLSSQSLAEATGFNVAVGAGGSYRLNGSNSQFGSLTTAVGGGSGGTQGYQGLPGQNGQAGGSGGGGGSGTTFYPAGAGTSTQGNAGGDGYNSSSSPTWAGGGGGGAGVAGTAAGSSAGGKGGNGVSTYSSWGSATGTGENIGGTYWYAGGGGGGTFYGGGATGGAKGNGGGSAGRNGDTEATAANGMANTGGGAGSQFGFGGSGIIIIRYPMA